MLAQVQALIGPEGKNAVESMLASGQKASSGIFATLLGLLTLLFGASGVFGELRSALNAIWEAEPKGSSGVWRLLRERVFSFGIVFSVGFVLIVSLLASAALAAATKFFSGLIPIPHAVLGTINFIVSFLGISVLFALILKYVPETRVEWRDVRAGAACTALLFTLGKSLLGLYLGKASPGSAYGAAGSLVVLVIWVYYSAQIFFFAAEFTHVLAMSRDGGLASDDNARGIAGTGPPRGNDGTLIEPGRPLG
jgi:membrane protein